jgi:hypothetical protein
LLPLRLGTRPIGLLATAGRPIESGTFDALAGLALARRQQPPPRSSIRSVQSLTMASADSDRATGDVDYRPAIVGEQWRRRRARH